MQGFAGKKKEEAKLLEEQKKKPKSPSPLASSMSEGPMLLAETRSLEERARAAYERSVKIELAAIRRLEKLKKKGKRRAKGRGRRKKAGK